MFVRTWLALQDPWFMFLGEAILSGLCKRHNYISSLRLHGGKWCYTGSWKGGSPKYWKHAGEPRSEVWCLPIDLDDIWDLAGSNCSSHDSKQWKQHLGLKNGWLRCGRERRFATIESIRKLCRVTKNHGGQQLHSQMYGRTGSTATTIIACNVKCQFCYPCIRIDRIDWEFCYRFTTPRKISMRSDPGITGGASVLRVARVLRVLRTARMARLVRLMPELMILIKGQVLKDDAR